MKVVQCQQDVRGVESGGVFLETADLGKVEEEFTSRTILKHKEQLAIALERVIHLNDEGMPNVFLHTENE